MSFERDDFVQPNHTPDKKTTQATYLMSYEFYSDLILYLSSHPKKITQLHRNSYRDRKLSKKFDTFSEQDWELIDVDHQYNEDFTGLSDFQMHMMIFNSENMNEDLLNSRLSRSSKSGSINESLFSEAEFIDRAINKDNESTSKFDTYLEEIIELIVRDFFMVPIGDLLWDKEKFASMAK